MPVCGASSAPVWRIQNDLGAQAPLKKEILANLGTVDLVSTDGHQVNVHLVHVQRNFTHCLGSVSVKKYLHRSSLNNLYGLQYL